MTPRKTADTKKIVVEPMSRPVTFSWNRAVKSSEPQPDRLVAVRGISLVNAWVCNVGGKGLANGTIESKVRAVRPSILNVFNQSPPRPKNGANRRADSEKGC